jgi:phosphate transport system substrate-binding protein
MKKLICVILCVVMLAACNDTETVGNDEQLIITPETTTAPATTADITTSPEPEIPTGLPVLPLLTLEEMPRIDGSTAAIPLAEALYALILGIPRSEAAAMINFNGTAESYRNLMNEWNDCKLILAYEPPPAVADEIGRIRWELAPIGRDALVFIVNESNPVQNITTEQARMIYTGEITNWSELGGNDVMIEPFQRNATSGSQTLFIKLVMGDIEPMTPDIKYLSGGMGPLIESVASFNNTGAAIGFSVYYYAQYMNPNEGLRFLSIDGVMPSHETIRDGSYPHVNDFYAGIASNAPANSHERMIWNWLQSDEGKVLIEREGYVSVIDTN